MTQDEFIKVLDGKEYTYEIEGDKIIITYAWTVDLGLIKSLPSNVEFRNKGHVWLSSLESLPSGVEFFNNSGSVNLSSFIGGWISGWEGNIKGIDSKMLLNLMIKRGMFI
jgi:hypothetical protein